MFLVTDDVEHLFMGLLVICVPPSWQNGLSRSVVHFELGRLFIFELQSF